MTAVGESESALASKCLDLCQTLMSQGLAFKFSLTVGSGFAFALDTSLSLDTKGKEPVKKKPKPSTLRRNARRRDEFLKRKQAPLLESSATDTAKAKITTRPLKHLPSPTAPSQSRQVITVGRNSASPSFSQLDGSASPSPPTASLSIEEEEVFEDAPSTLDTSPLPSPLPTANHEPGHLERAMERDLMLHFRHLNNLKF